MSITNIAADGSPQYDDETCVVDNLTGYVWRRHTMETVSALLALCEGNPPVTGGFPSQTASNVGSLCVLRCFRKQTIKQTVELAVICDAMALM